MSKYTATKTVGDTMLSLSTDDKEYMTWFLTGEDALHTEGKWVNADWFTKSNFTNTAASMKR